MNVDDKTTKHTSETNGKKYNFAHQHANNSSTKILQNMDISAKHE
jgi:YHS domain-containing protein